MKKGELNRTRGGALPACYLGIAGTNHSVGDQSSWIIFKIMYLGAPKHREAAPLSESSESFPCQNLKSGTIQAFVGLTPATAMNRRDDNGI
jgi:hypothetical protein